ncbi:MAG TPA: methylated-DNA--[protein]-cysteine S-methyltransferase [Azospirillum sp.]|nr:methylated-DNA--[protein]-cysteine S-methyltransferase [Azospirillum sp.]
MPSLTVPSPLGPLRLTSAGGALTALDWGAGAADDPDPVLEEAARQLAEYFAGKRTAFELPMRPAGTAFQQRVWELMLRIPHGETMTYGDMAHRLGSAARAVGGACGRNPLPILIPCHRVVGGGGKSGGYSGFGGVETKAWLLGHERRMSLVAP